MFFTLGAIAAALIVAIWALQFSRRTAWLYERILQPRVFILLAGSIAGVLAGAPTILWRAQSFFESIQMYTTSYVDVERMTWPVARHMAWLFDFYMRGVATDWLSLSLIALGAALIVIRRDRRLMPFLIGALLFFVSRPLNTAPFQHQMVPWMPLFAVVAGYGPALAYQSLDRVRHSGVLRAAALAGLLIAMACVMEWGPRTTAGKADQDEQRMSSIALATDWIHGHAEPDAAVAISYYCFNSDVFFTWIRFLDVPQPPSVDPRRYLATRWASIPALKVASKPTPARLRATSITLNASWIWESPVKDRTRFTTPVSSAQPLSERIPVKWTCSDSTLPIRTAPRAAAHD